MNAPRVSVVVAARNCERSLARLLGCLEGQSLPRVDFEVIVVDDASTDATAEVATGSARARLIRAPRRGGAYMARNLGLRAARGEILAITDADCEPAPDWLECALADLQSSGADLVGGRIDIPLRQRPTVAEMIDFARYNHQERILAEGGFASTSNLLFRREVMERVGLFHEGTISQGDREFCLRATAAGFTLAYSPNGAVAHAPRLRARDLVRKTVRMGVGRSQLRAGVEGAMRDGLPRIWSRPGAWVPRRGVYGGDLLEERGVELTWLGMRRLELGEWALVQLPLAAGSMWGSAKLTLGRPRRAQEGASA